MKRLIFLISIFLTSLVFARKVDVSTSHKEVAIGNNFTLSIKFQYDGDVEPYVSFEPKNVEVIDDNSSDGTRVSTRGTYRGGKLVANKYYHFKYVLQPVSKGTAHIRNIKIDLGDDVIKIPSQRVRVLAKARKLRDFELRAEVDNSTPYVGEGLNLNYYLYFLGEISQPDVRKFPKLKGFLKRFELPRDGVERVQMNGKIVKRLLIYKARIYPESSGKLVIDPLEIAFQYRDRKTMRRDIFGMAMTFRSGANKSKTLRSKRVKLDVQPLPVANVPKNFTGLVGDHDFNLTLRRSRIVVNDILEARLEVTGEGALEKMDPPRIIKSDNFEYFEPKTEIVKMAGLVNKKVIDYTYLAKRSLKLPEAAFKLSIFDPKKREYVEKEIVIPELQVFGSGVKSETISSNQGAGPEESVNKDSDNGLTVVAPILNNNPTRSTLLNINALNTFLFVILLLVLFGNIGVIKSLIPQRSFKAPKNLDYNFLHDFIVGQQNEGLTIREKIENAPISSDAKSYFSDLLEKAENNAYKGKTHKLKLNKKYFREFAKATEHESL